MLSHTDMIRDVLPPTKTYHVREFVFIPGDGEDGIGRLTLKLQHRRGVHRAYDLDSYTVDRDTPEPGDNGGAAFWLMNVAPDAEEPYRCVVGGLNALPRCNCKAGKCRVPADESTDGCKHRDAILHLIEAGFLAM
jgi:hypothetical protein